MQLAPLKAAEVLAAAASVVDATPDTNAADQCNLGVCEEVILAGKEADISELGFMEAIHLTSLAFKVSGIAPMLASAKGVGDWSILLGPMCAWWQKA